ncbi:MAG: flagellar hook capping FlgD N-terminal domain-containing protein [Paracoccaceae bacterium]
MDPLLPVTPASTPTPNSSFGSAAGGDFTTFLRMLTTQMENQDPLNPMESTDFAVQLATFSGVEQQVQTNRILSSLAGQFGLMGMAQLSGWIGQEARSSAPVFYDGQPVTLSFQPAATADDLVLVIRDARGNLLSRESVPPGQTSHRWLGGDAAGNPAAPGLYSFQLESLREGEVIRTDPVQSYAPITEARRDGDKITLILRGGVAISADDVTALRAP